MMVGLALTSALAAAIAERRVTTPAGGLRMSAVLLTLRVSGGAMFVARELEDTLWLYFRNAPARTMSVNSDQATFLFIVLSPTCLALARGRTQSLSRSSYDRQ